MKSSYKLVQSSLACATPRNQIALAHLRNERTLLTAPNANTRAVPHAATNTKSSTFLEACRFCHHLLGAEGAKDVAGSVRNTGSAAKNFVRKKAWKPASVLTVDEVLSLHDVLMTDEVAVVDRVFAGHFLHMLLSRSRWSDLLSVQSLYCDEPDVVGSRVRIDSLQNCQEQSH